MIRKLPLIDSAANLRDILAAFRSANDKHAGIEFKNILSVISGMRNICTAGSGIAAFYLILKALHQISPRKEVVLPAYTAGSLVVAVRKAGLKPVLCDISLTDFNMDAEALQKSISPGTLAVVAVHMFGIGMKGVEGLRAGLSKDIYLIEDCCQAMGSIVSERPVGSWGDASLFSFNRGKNLPLCGGGFASTEDLFIAKAIEDEMGAVEDTSVLRELLMPIEVLAVSIATNPFIYGLGHGVISRFKEDEPPEDFPVRKMSDFHIALGMRLLKRMEELSLKRYYNGMHLINGLKNLAGVVLPTIVSGSRPVFNRLPVVFKNPEMRTRAEDKLAENGIEASRMYLRPLHHMFDLGYERSAFPNANYVAENLLTLPVHSGVRKKDLGRMVSAITEASI